ncbi:MAG TPA: hypothetical protein VLH79_07205 [Chthonomonadales bacterium]|nr:hypothetical protein [Chthonomonadales bacterium]
MWRRSPGMHRADAPSPASGRASPSAMRTCSSPTWTSSCRRRWRASSQRQTRTASARVLAEGENWPTTREADAVLASQGVHSVTDVPANAGGAIVSCVGRIQDQQSLFWSVSEVS